ncbi:hypothetical protein D9758_009332 [Tetrapyrgos nigripes]|uniref:Uncharacterized protein n=1 Tax=Tetrapyrgos nigripes TaxID=182062 RepID=A0A8H5GH82_9AGAR|nr:hypothetical protein D9758_009332 [Tetrapyrgos nigripes]
MPPPLFPKVSSFSIVPLWRANMRGSISLTHQHYWISLNTITAYQNKIVTWNMRQGSLLGEVVCRQDGWDAQGSEVTAWLEIQAAAAQSQQTSKVKAAYRKLADERKNNSFAVHPIRLLLHVLYHCGLGELYSALAF